MWARLDCQVTTGLESCLPWYFITPHRTTEHQEKCHPGPVLGIYLFILTRRTDWDNNFPDGWHQCHNIFTFSQLSVSVSGCCEKMIRVNNFKCFSAGRLITDNCLHRENINRYKYSWLTPHTRPSPVPPFHLQIYQHHHHRLNGSRRFSIQWWQDRQTVKQQMTGQIEGLKCCYSWF